MHQIRLNCKNGFPTKLQSYPAFPLHIPYRTTKTLPPSPPPPAAKGGGRRHMPDTAPAMLPGVPCWQREIYGNAVLATTNEQRRTVCPQSAERTKPSAAAHLRTALRAANILPCAVRLWSEHAFHRSPPAASAEHPAAWQGLCPACAGVPPTPPNIQVC